MRSAGKALRAASGFTLVEMLVALMVVSLLSVMSYRALGSVLDARTRVKLEADKWARISGFFERFEYDVRMAAPRAVRQGDQTRPAWSGSTVAGSSIVEFSRFGNAPGEPPRRLAYRLNQNGDIELLMWARPDLPPGTQPMRYAVLSDVTVFELRYFNAVAGWVDTWPGSALDSAVPQAVRVRISMSGKDEFVRIFALKS